MIGETDKMFRSEEEGRQRQERAKLYLKLGRQRERDKREKDNADDAKDTLNIFQFKRWAEKAAFLHKCFTN